MWLQFVLENAHFAVNLFAALVFFAVSWLYFDAWQGRKSGREILRIAGFFLISVSYLIHATQVESTILPVPFFAGGTIELLVSASRIIGYLILLFILWIEPLEKHPGEGKKSVLPALVMPTAGMAILAVPHALFPILGALVGLLYLRRATIGLEDHLKPVAYSFFLLAFSDLIGLSSIFQHTTNVAVYDLVRPFGVLWIIEHLFLLAASVGFGMWVFRYLLKQFEAQLFMILTTSIVIIFLITTVVFTGLLLKNIEDATTTELKTDVNVLSYVIDSKKAELLSDVEVVAQNPDIIDATSTTSRVKLAGLLPDILLAKNESTLVVTGDAGQVLVRGENINQPGASLSNDSLVKRALLGQSAASVVTHDGVLAPIISIEAAAPIRSNGTIVGVVLAGTLVDNAFVDGIKTATNLDAVIYGDNQVSASTLVMPDGKSRLVGIKEEHAAIKTAVLTNGGNYTGSITLVSQPYFGAYLPIRDVDGNPIGMLLVARPEVSVLTAAGRSIEFTFLLAAVLLVLAIVPAYFIAAYIASQV